MAPKTSNDFYAYREELALRICGELSIGRSLRDICEHEFWAPERRTVMRWLHLHPEFAQMYTQARALGAEAMADDLLAIADAATPDDVQVAKLRSQNRMWLMSKMNVKRFGDRQQIDMVADVAVTTTNTLDISELSIDEMLVLESALNKSLAAK